MSEVKTKITVTDGVTSTVRRMQNSVSGLISKVVQLDKEFDKAFNLGKFSNANQALQSTTSNMQAINDSTKAFEEQLNKVREDIQGIRNIQGTLAQSQNSFNASLGSSASGANTLLNTMKKIVAVVSTGYGVKKLIEKSDNWTNTQARLRLNTDTDGERNVLQLQAYQAALRSRGDYKTTADTIAKLGLLAGDAFNSNTETVLFAELMNKSFKLSGASTEEKNAGMYQLTQAMASGKLQGDEFRSIMENAPMLAQAIADYTGKTKGDLKEMSADGAITADIIKGALFNAADDINSKFETMPMTFADSWTNVVTQAQQSFSGLYEQMNNMLNSDIGQGVFSGIIDAIKMAEQYGQLFLSTLNAGFIVASPGIDSMANSAANFAKQIFGASGVVSGFVQNISRLVSSQGFAESLNIIGGTIITIGDAINFVINAATPLLPLVTGVYVAFKTYNTISPILNTVCTGIGSVVSSTISLKSALAGATTAQNGLNAAMNANPYLLVASAVAKVIAMLVSLIATIKAVNAAAGLAADSQTQASLEAIQYKDKHGVSLATAQQIVSTKKTYNDQIDGLNDDIKDLKEKRNKLQTRYGTLFGDSGNLSVTAMTAQDNYVNKQLSVIDKQISEKNKQINTLRNARYEETLNAENADKANQKAMAELNKISTNPSDYISNSGMNIGGDGKDKKTDVGTVDEVNKINDTVDIASEDLKYMRELAEQEIINQFTSKLIQPSINVTFGEVTQTADVDAVVKQITTGLVDSLNNSSDLVHI